MTHLTALRTSVLCGFAVVAVAGCGAARLGSIGGTSAPTAGVTTIAPAPTSSTAPDSSGVSQQISNIDSQLSAIDGQLNAAGAGLNTSEGDPSQ
jgi:hypothetical protein